MLYGEIIAVYSEIYTKYVNTVCGQKAELLNFKLVVHIVTTVRYRVKQNGPKSPELSHYEHKTSA